jgi:hypothetical protein
MARTEEDVRVRMREILGRFETLTPRDFLILKVAKIHCKSGSRRNPTHSIPLEIIPAVKEVLEEWKRSRGATLIRALYSCGVG